MPVRKIFSPEMLADGMLRYERGDLVEDIAADWKCHVHTVTRTAQRQGWVRNRTRPPQELPDARWLQRQMEVAAERGGARDAPLSIAQLDVGEPPQRRGTAPAAPLPTLPLGADVPLALLATDQVERAVLKQLADIETTRVRLGEKAQTPAEAHHTARTLATLTQTLQRLQELRSSAAPVAGPYDDDDDMPRDIDEFRNELARRIRLLVQSETGGEICDAGEAADGHSTAG